MFLIPSPMCIQEHELYILREINHLESLLEDINKQTVNPNSLPLAGEDMLRSMKLSENPYMEDIVRLTLRQSNESPSPFSPLLFLLQFPLRPTSCPWVSATLPTPVSPPPHILPLGLRESFCTDQQRILCDAQPLCQFTNLPAHLPRSCHVHIAPVRTLFKLTVRTLVSWQSPPDSPSLLPRHLTTPAPAHLPTSPYNRKDPPRTPPPPPPSSETDPYFNAFSRHYSFSTRHSGTRSRVPPTVAPSTSPKKGPALCMRTSSFSMSSTSSQSSMSSLGSTGSPSTESLPHPPPPPPALLSPQGSIDSEPMPPPPPFPGAAPTIPPPGKLLAPGIRLSVWPAAGAPKPSFFLFGTPALLSPSGSEIATWK